VSFDRIIGDFGRSGPRTGVSVGSAGPSIG